MSQFQILGRRPFPFKAVSVCFAYTNFPDTIRGAGVTVGEIARGLVGAVAGRLAADLAEAARKMILASLELAEKVDAALHGRLNSGSGGRPKPLTIPICRSLRLSSAARR